MVGGSKVTTDPPMTCMWSRLHCGFIKVAKMTSEQADSGPAAQFSWIKDGGLVEEELKAVVSALAKKLSSSSLDVQREGASSLLSLINSVWSLEIHVARDSADLIAIEIRYTKLALTRQRKTMKA